MLEGGCAFAFNIFAGSIDVYLRLTFKQFLHVLGQLIVAKGCYKSDLGTKLS